jgi:biotin transporter BioY
MRNHLQRSWTASSMDEIALWLVVALCVIAAVGIAWLHFWR